MTGQRTAGRPHLAEVLRRRSILEETRTVLLGSRSGGRRQIEAPLRIGNIKLGEMIGEGGGGVVFQGADSVLNRRVAVKLMFSTAHLTSDEVSEMVAGVRVAAGIKHPHIVGVHTVEIFNGQPVVVMEYVEGLSVRGLLSRVGKLDLSLTGYLLTRVASAVGTLHEAGVLHRDLKPANLLVDRAGTPFVCDFGLACGFDRRRSQADAGEVGGSPRYMAPEMFEGHVTPRSDVYALGVIMFELLTGQPPFDASSLHDMQAAHASQDIPIDRLHAHGVPEAWCDVIERALHKQAFLRHKSAAHLLRALEPLAVAAGIDAAQSRLAGMICRPEDADAADRTPSSDYGNTFDLIRFKASQKRERRDTDSA